MSEQHYNRFVNDDISEDSQVPSSEQVKAVDRFNLHKIAFILFGIVSTLPLILFPTATNYWMYKFRDVNGQHTFGPIANKTELQKYFFSYLSIANCAPNIAAMVFCTLLGHRISQHVRNTVSLIAIAVSTVVTSSLVYVNSDYHQTAFLWFTLVTAVIINAFGTIFQGTILAFAAQFPPSYVHALVSAQSLSGIVIVAIQVFIYLTNVSVLAGAFLFFIVADLVVFICIVLYFCTQKTAFTREHETKVEKSQVNASFSILKRSLKLVWIPALSGLIVLGQSAAILPALLLVVPEHPGSSVWTGKIFVQLWCLLPFFLVDFVGRKIAGYFPLKNKVVLLCLSILRILFIPVLLRCNLQPRTTLPVLYHSEAAFTSILAAFALVGGYLAAIPMYASNSVPDDLREAVTFVVITANVVGTTSGSFLSLVLVQML